MAPKIRPADVPDAVRGLQDYVNRLNDSVSSSLNEVRRTAAQDKKWLQGNLDINTGAISKLNGDLYLYSQRISSLEKEVGRLKSSRFSFKTYLSRLFNALRNKP